MMKRKIKKKKKKVYKKNRFQVYNTENKEFLPDIKKNRKNSQMNFVLLNKDVKYQVKRSNNNFTKNLSKKKILFKIQ